MRQSVAAIKPLKMRRGKMEAITEMRNLLRLPCFDSVAAVLIMNK